MITPEAASGMAGPSRDHQREPTMRSNPHILLLTGPDLAWAVDRAVTAHGPGMPRDFRAYDRDHFLARLRAHRRGIFRVDAIVADLEALSGPVPGAVGLAREYAPDVPVLVAGQKRDAAALRAAAAEGGCGWATWDDIDELYRALEAAVDEAERHAAERGPADRAPEPAVQTPGLPSIEALIEGQQIVYDYLWTIADRVWVKDADGTFLYANEAFARDLVCTPDELVGRTDCDVWGQRDGRRYQREDREALAAGAPAHELSESGSSRRSKFPIKDRAGEPVALLVVMGQLHERWLETHRRLAHLASLAICSADAVAGLGPDGQVEFWNPAAESIYGYSSAEMAGQSIAVLAPPETRDEFQDRIERTALARTVHRYETVHVSKDGRRVNVSLTISPIVDPNRELIGMCLIGRDITERIRMQTELRDTLEQLARANTELGQFAYVASKAPSQSAHHRDEVEQIARAVRNDPFGSFDFRAEARRVNVSYSHFRRLFREYMGRSPRDYQLLWRMRRAARELRHSDRPVKAVAIQAGYENPADFSRAFKRQIGLSPTEYRDTMQAT
jgi:PAS domain S-box-containing protein